MNLILSLDDAEAQLARKRTAKAAEIFDTAVLAIYSLTVKGRNPKFSPAGSCILLSVDDQPVMSTAAHILDERTRGVEIYVAGTSGLVAIQGGMIRTTNAPKGDRNLDHFDCGFWAMPDRVVSELGAVRFISEALISPNRAPIGHRYYNAMGYRISRNKNSVNYTRKQISPARSGYTGTVTDHPELAQALKVDGKHHLFLNFPKNVADESGVSANAFSPVGLSGGALIDLGDFMHLSAHSSSSLWRPALSGMLIEHQRRFDAMIAVRIEWILDHVRKALATSQ